MESRIKKFCFYDFTKICILSSDCNVGELDLVYNCLHVNVKIYVGQKGEQKWKGTVSLRQYTYSSEPIYGN